MFDNKKLLKERLSKSNFVIGAESGALAAISTQKEMEAPVSKHWENRLSSAEKSEDQLSY
jgi:demethoxyubiquinone hydroxylase (CLK1/Coq7/Cat5 family)